MKREMFRVKKTDHKVERRWDASPSLAVPANRRKNLFVKCRRRSGHVQGRYCTPILRAACGRSERFMEENGGLPLERGFGRTLGRGSIGRWVFADGSNVHEVFGPRNALTAELWKRRGRWYAWRLGLLLWFAAERKHDEQRQTPVCKVVRERLKIKEERRNKSKECSERWLRRRRKQTGKRGPKKPGHPFFGPY